MLSSMERAAALVVRLASLQLALFRLAWVQFLVAVVQLRIILRFAH